jgi:hypothetical protein
MTCQGCSGSGACDPCDGYGILPDSFPNAGDGLECDVCSGDGVCAECWGTGETPIHDNDSDNGSDDNGSDDNDVTVSEGAMT